MDAIEFLALMFLVVVLGGLGFSLGVRRGRADLKSSAGTLVALVRGLDRILKGWASDLETLYEEHRRQLEFLDGQPGLRERMAATLGQGNTIASHNARLLEEHIRVLRELMESVCVGAPWEAKQG